MIKSYPPNSLDPQQRGDMTELILSECIYIPPYLCLGSIPPLHPCSILYNPTVSPPIEFFTTTTTTNDISRGPHAVYDLGGLKHERMLLF